MKMFKTNIMDVVKGRGGKRHNLASIIKKWTTEQCTADHEIVSHKTKSTDAATLLANAVSAKIEDGNIRSAIRIVCSEDKPAQTRTACTHNWLTSIRHLCQIEVPFQIHNQRWLSR